MLSTSLAFLRSLWIRANSTLRRSAIAVTLFAPPASGETMMPLRHSGMFSRIHFSTAGSAYRLSTGMSKKP
uniref:Putative secreted protein n=1 Tax=Ixodes ricinus TaxID=34613 RepID=A0A6B0TS40_IXORI